MARHVTSAHSYSFRCAFYSVHSTCRTTVSSPGRGAEQICGSVVTLLTLRRFAPLVSWTDSFIPPLPAPSPP